MFPYSYRNQVNSPRTRQMGKRLQDHYRILPSPCCPHQEPSRFPWLSDWWFGTFFIFPYIGNHHPNWLIFFRGVQTTNQLSMSPSWTSYHTHGHFWGLPLAGESRQRPRHLRAARGVGWAEAVASAAGRCDVGALASRLSLGWPGPMSLLKSNILY